MSASNTLQCPLAGNWLSFRLVDEHGKGEPYAGLAYELTDNQGLHHSGTLDAEGYARIDNIYAGPALLSFTAPYVDADPWYKDLMERRGFPLPLTALQVAAEKSPRGPRDASGKTFEAKQRVQQEKATFYRIEVSSLVTVTSHLPVPDATLAPKPADNLATCVQQKAPAATGVALLTGQHHVLEVKALRAYRPLLSLSKEFNTLDAYQFALMATQSYAPFNLPFEEDPKGEAKPPYSVPGTLGHVLDTTLAHCAEPDTFGGATPYHLLTEEVPYSKRLEIVPYDDEHFAGLNEERRTPQAVHFLHQPANILRGTLGEAQAFITHDDRMILIVARGTQENCRLGTRRECHSSA